MINFYKNKLLILFLVSVINISCSESVKASFGTREIVSGVSAVAGALCFSKTDAVLKKLFPDLYERASSGDLPAINELKNRALLVRLISGLVTVGGGYFLLSPHFESSDHSVAERPRNSRPIRCNS
jgi:hypothetical protein